MAPGVAAGSSKGLGGGLGSAELQQDAGTKPNADEMSETDVSASDAEQEARNMNGEKSKGKTRMKRADAKMAYSGQKEQEHCC